MKYRIEKDSIGEIKVPADKLWGAQTQRSFQNFKIGTEMMPIQLIYALAIIKKSAAMTNKKLGKLDIEKADAIIEAVNDILKGKLDEHFPLVEILQLPENYGFAKGYNEALKRVEADYFILLNLLNLLNFLYLALLCFFGTAIFKKLNFNIKKVNEKKVQVSN